ncbi:enoyl-CoA hydratase/isomerase family protein [Sneathiella sp.]|uniref:enoyl-CoA hydratase/isomerase family protein n=1 Tax=Sneathiella sp. TaxID=1964365 RepID=UPI003568B143
MSAPVTTYSEGAVGIIELSRPEKFNCLSRETHGLIDKARVDFEANSAIRALLIRATGKHFCTGADLDEVKGIMTNADALDDFIASGMGTFSRLEKCSLPVIVAVQGLCLAGGTELMLSADICFAGKSAKFGDQHAEFGLIPGWGGSQRLTRLIGMRRALDLMFSARWLSADEGKEAGLVNYLVEDDELHSKALDYAQTVATRSRRGIAEMKRLARDGIEMSLEQGLRLERDAAVRHLQDSDVAEGLDAFENRRKPKFKQ